MGGVKTPAITLNPTSLTFNATVGGGNPATQSFTVQNSGQGGSTLNWTGTDNAAWLSISPASGALAQGATPTSVTVTVTTGALTAATYNGTITISDLTVATSAKIATITTPAAIAGPISASSMLYLPAENLRHGSS